VNFDSRSLGSLVRQLKLRAESAERELAALSDLTPEEAADLRITSRIEREAKALYESHHMEATEQLRRELAEVKRERDAAVANANGWRESRMSADPTFELLHRLTDEGVSLPPELKEAFAAWVKAEGDRVMQAWMNLRDRNAKERR